jgi:hypothetical protein
VRLAKHFVWEKLSKKVQFLQPNNDDVMKKKYAMARKYMNYEREKLSKKVQFLQPNNDDMMKKKYAMAQKYMNYDANDFSSVWTKVVLPTIKSEMNLLRSGYAAAIKNRIICSKVIHIVGHTSGCN